MAVTSMLPWILLVVSWSWALPLSQFDEVEDYDAVSTGAANEVDEDTDRVLREYFDNVNAFLAQGVAEPSLATGKKVSEWNESSGVNAEETGGYLEGDILTRPALARNGLTAHSARWPGGVVPYEIDNSFGPKDLNMIEAAFKAYQSKTCVRFVQHNGERDYIRITRANTGCWSSVGRIGGMQEVNLQSPGCLTKVGTAIHELMHAVGFMHEQNRFSRDDYVTILWQNIEPNRNNNFDKAASGTTSGQGVGYDYNSVMHYSDKSFSKNNQPTIVAKKTGKHMGQRDGFSASDIKKINIMYECQTRRRDEAARPSFLQSIFG